MKKHDSQNEQIAKAIAEGNDLAEKALLLQQLTEITTLISEKPERAKKVLSALQKGVFDATYNDPTEYFNSQYRFMYRLPKVHLGPLLYRMCQDITPDRLNKFGPQMAKQLFFYAVRVIGKHKLFCMKKSTFDEIAVQKHTAYGSLLRTTNVVDLPEESCVWGTWFTEDNYCWKRASLHSPTKRVNSVYTDFGDNVLGERVDRPIAGDGNEAIADEDDDAEEGEEEDTAEDKPPKTLVADASLQSTPAAKRRKVAASPASSLRSPAMLGVVSPAARKPMLALAESALQDAIAKL